ncbi:MAG: PTS sugar transporter subunit IIA [Bacteroidetes bacterium]|nr:PTS sugar transporter subunit IIA [Bacteroidota bacterium]
MLVSLQKECISLGTNANSKDQILSEVSRLAKESKLLNNISQQDIEKKLIEREKVSSTGMENCIAIPHCSFDELEEFTVGLVIISEGIDFQSMDDKPAKLIFFIIGPTNQRNKHIQIISSIAKLTKDAALISKLLKSKDPESAYEILQKDIHIKETNQDAKKYCQFTIHIQNENLFTDVLEVLSSEAEGSISVLETNTAGYYLHKLPLFATFWNSSVPNFSRVLIAVINKNLMNDTLRRINMLNEDNTPGLLVTVQDIIYLDGAIDF